MEERLQLKKLDYYKANNIQVLLANRAMKIDRDSKKIYLQNGEKIDYTKLVIATGSRAKKEPLDEGDDYSNVFYLRNLYDAKNLKNVLATLEAPKALIVTENMSRELILASRNLQGVHAINQQSLNVYELLRFPKVIFVKDAMESLNARLSG